MINLNFSGIQKIDTYVHISKEDILAKVSEETIFEHYGVPIKKGLFCSKLRNDKHPTVALYRSKIGVLLMKDFGSDFCGDCFFYVANLFNVSYYEALKIVANDFGIIKSDKLEIHKPQIKYTGNKLKETVETEIKVEIRNFQDYELRWWSKYGITEKTLKKFNVFSCKNIWLNDNIFHYEKPNQLVFGYYGGIRQNIERWRIYTPHNRVYKFIGNWKSIMLQGAHQLPKDGGEYLVITKSLKDCLVLYELGIPAIAPCSEHMFMTNSQFNKLKSKFKNILCVYDNDLAGIQGLNKIHKAHPDLKITFIPRKYNAKDISDFYKLYGKDKTLKLIEEAKEYYFGKKENRCLQS